MKYTYEQKLKHETERRTSRDSQKEFFRGAVNRMNFNSNVEDIVKDKIFACDVLCHVGFCLFNDCDHCLLEGKYQEALNDFARGIRK